MDTGADHICRLLVCGHGRPYWMGPDFSTLSRLWCDDCGEMVPWVRAGWSGLPGVTA